LSFMFQVCSLFLFVSTSAIDSCKYSSPKWRVNSLTRSFVLLDYVWGP